jgi:predicted nucleic acid-binding protein
MSYVTQPADTSVFLQVLAQIDPANTTAVSLMNDVFNNQLQLAAGILNLQKHGVAVDDNLHQLAESIAANTLPNFEKITNEVNSLL